MYYVNGVRMSLAQAQAQSEGLGFSLKPPKWLRKAQPGKILAKVAVPALAIGASLLIPGVGTAVAAGLTAAAKGAGAVLKAVSGGVGTAAGAAVDVVKATAPVAGQVLTAVATPSMPTSPPVMTTVPVPSNTGSSPYNPVGYGGQQYMPAVVGPRATGAEVDWTMPAIIAGGALLLAMTMNRKH